MTSTASAPLCSKRLARSAKQRLPRTHAQRKGPAVSGEPPIDVAPDQPRSGAGGGGGGGGGTGQASVTRIIDPSGHVCVAGGGGGGGGGGGASTATGRGALKRARSVRP